MVLVLGQGHSDAHPCILQICTVASLSSPLRGPSVCSSLSRPHEVFTRKVTQKKETLEWKLVLSLLLLLFLTQINEPAMPMSTQLNDLIGNPGAESPGSETPGDSGTPGSPRRRRTLHRRGLEKLALNSGTPGGARKRRKMRLKTRSSHPTEKQPVSVQTGMSTKPGDELILRHLQLRACVTACSQGRPHLVDELCQQTGTTGTSTTRFKCTATAGPSQFSGRLNHAASVVAQRTGM